MDITELESGATRPRPPFDHEELESEVEARPVPASDHSPERRIKWRLLLQSMSDRKILSVEVDNQITLGRTDLAQSFVADVDLTLLGGRGAGVSRRHAAIYLTRGGLHIRDLDSTNGTAINGVPLDPYHLYQIQEGDRLTVGSLELLLFSAQPVP